MKVIISTLNEPKDLKAKLKTKQKKSSFDMGLMQLGWKKLAG